MAGKVGMGVVRTTYVIDEKGFIGIFTGGTAAAAGGIAASIFFGFVMAIIFKPKQK